MVQTKFNITLQVPKQGIPNSPDSLPRTMKENLNIIVIICKLGNNFQLVSKSKAFIILKRNQKKIKDQKTQIALF
jgi:hypothetical protein